MQPVIVLGGTGPMDDGGLQNLRGLLGRHLKTGQLWTGQNPASWASGQGDIFLVACSAGKA